MGRRRSIYVLGTRRQRRTEARLRASERRNEPARATTMDRHRVPLFHPMLFGVGLLLLATALSIGITLNNAAPSSNPEEMSFMAKSNAAMAKMMAGMKIKLSHNVDKDFVAMMVPHHQGAIDMAQAELIYGHDEPLRGLAQEIIATQQQEIVAMQLHERR